MRIVFCGDIVPTAASAALFESGDCAALMGGALPVLRNADHTLGNLECALTESGKPIRKCGPNLKGKPVCAETLRACGFTALGLSNNHVLDFGVAGLNDTEQALERAGIAHFGTGENDRDSRGYKVFESNGVRVAVVAVCEHEYSYALPDRKGSNPFDPFDTMEDIALAKADADFVVVMYHGGKEQCEYPSPRLRKACRAMVRAGADIVLCQHSHCIGCREEYRGGEIVYGQGNFHFVKYIDHPQWQTGLIACAEFEKGERPRIEYKPVRTDEHGIDLASDAEEILAEFRRRSGILQDEQAWRGEWEAFCTQPGFAYYRNAVRDAYTDVPEGESVRQVFPHYLDCEAHLDVWKTLYRTWHAEKTSERE